MKTGLLFALLCASTVHAALYEATNLDQNPMATWGFDEVGWVYTQSHIEDYSLTAVQTRFCGYDADLHDWDREVVLEIYDAPPSEGGMLLREAAFRPVPDLFVGVAVAPLLFERGQSYFIGLRNVFGIGTNTNLSGPDKLPFYFSLDEVSAGRYEIAGFPEAPVLAFFGEPVPEPGTAVLLGIGALMLRRKRGARMRRGEGNGV